MNSRTNRSWILFAALLVSGCISAADYQDVKIELPKLWNRIAENDPLEAPLVTADENAPIDHRWWEQFHDPLLNQLVDESLKGSKTLAIAKLRIEEARADRLTARSILFPQFDATGRISRENQGEFVNDKPISIKEIGVRATWELDLFGRNQARAAAADAILQSTEAASRGVRIGLLAEVARNYFDARNFQRQIAITEKNLGTQRETFKVTEDQMEGALASGLDVERAGAQVSTTESLLPTLRTAYDQSTHRLDVLLGRTPGYTAALMKEPAELKPIDTKVLLTTPAKVIANRPDVMAAERELAARTSLSDVAIRSFLPDISLLGFYGVQESATPFTAAASVVQPILHFGQLKAGIDATSSREEQAFLNYQETVLTALADMEDALAAYLNESARNRSLKTAAEQTRKAAVLSRDQFTNGFSGILDVLVAERDALNAEAQLAASDSLLRSNLVAVYANAGGGAEEVKPAPKEKSKDAPKEQPVNEPAPEPKA